MATFDALAMTASLSLPVAPNEDGTPATNRTYRVELINSVSHRGVIRDVPGPGIYPLGVQPGNSYFFQVTYAPYFDKAFNSKTITASSLVTFDPNRGSESMETQSASTAGRLTQIATVITRSGYAFGGWATTPTGDPAYADEAPYPFTASATLYATWGCLPLALKASAIRIARKADVKFIASSSESPWTSFTAFSAREGAKGSTNDTSSNTGTITVSGLKSKSGYTFDVTATNAAGCKYTTQTNRVLMWM